MTDEDITSTLTDDTRLFMAQLALAQSIKAAFQSASPAELRRWYVETFVLDPSNVELLPQLGGSAVLEDSYVKQTWYTTEHAAIGHRLLWSMKPELLAESPNVLEVENWRAEDPVLDTMMYLFQPWQSIRYDPDSENWYTAIQPGQWQRHGKGAPGENAVENRIKQWLDWMDLKNGSERYAAWPAKVLDVPFDELVARQNGVIAAFRKFKVGSRTKQNIRKAMERHPIMHLDGSTLNQIRDMAPFANGALVLIKTKYTTPDGIEHTMYPGTLRTLDIEYMVTNANPLPWLDAKGRIPEALNNSLAMEGDFFHLNDVVDDLLLRDCPTYWSFLTHSFPDPDERSAFLRLLGSAMFGTNLKIVAAMIGEPNAGKDTVINWLSYLMQGQVATLPFSAFTPYGDEDRGFAPLRGARVATVSGEVGEGRGSKLLAEKIKTVSSGGGKIRVAEKYEKPSDIFFDGMLLLQGNSVPMISGGDTALYTNRLVAVEFKHPFPLVSRSYESLYRSEAPFFAQVLFCNYLMYLHDGGGMSGINPPESWRSFAKEFADASNPHGFLEACITTAKTEQWYPTHQFHQALSAMIQKFGSPYPVGPNYWPKQLRKLGFATKGTNSIRKQRSVNGTPTWCYNLTLNADNSDGAFTQEQWERILKDAAVTS